MTIREELEQLLLATEAERPALGDTITDTLIATIREKLAASSLTEPQRKQITILFVVLSGFTNLSTKLPSTELKPLMNILRRGLDKIVIAYGGLIDSHMAEGIVALWGPTTAREDDPEQAIRAALALQTAVDTWQPEIPSITQATINAFKSQLVIQTGIHTGTVFLSENDTAKNLTALGEAVNIAILLQKKAPAGKIVISQKTYTQIKGIFQVTPFEPLPLTNNSTPIQTYLIEQAQPHAFQVRTRGVEGVKTQMVGREAELKQVKKALTTVAMESTLRLITIVGEAGLGKSRLFNEFEQWYQNRPQRLNLFKGRATQGMRYLPFSLMRDIFSAKFQIQDNDAPALAQQKMEQGFIDFMGQAGVIKAHFIGHLLGFNLADSLYLRAAGRDSQQIRNRAFHYCIQFFESVARKAPIIIVLDDIHWGDDGSLSLLTHLVDNCHHLPLLILCLSRPTLFEHRPAWREDPPWRTHLFLQPLSKEDIGGLIAEILHQAPAVPAVLQALVVKQSEGNPFYVEELIKMMIEDGVLLKEAETWQFIPNRLIEGRLPTTLTGVLQARLDRLTTTEQEILQRASVIGRAFWDKAVVFLLKNVTSTNPVPSDISDLLTTLQIKEIISPRTTSTFSQTNEYGFKHTIFHEVIYENIPQLQRRLYHQAAAKWLIAQSGERVNEYAGLIADHFEQAGNLEQAKTYLKQTAQLAFETSAFNEAMAAFQRLLNLTNITPEEEIDLTIRLGECFSALTDYNQANQHLLNGLNMARTLPDKHRISKALSHLGRVAVRQGNYDEAKLHLEDSLSLAREVKDDVSVAHTLYSLGMVNTYSGQYKAGKDAFQESLALYGSLDDQYGIAEALNGLGVVAWSLKEYPEAKIYHTESLAICRKLGYGWGISRSLNNLAYGAIREEDYQTAETYLQEAVAIAREIGSVYLSTAYLNTLGQVAAAAGHNKTAYTYYCESLKEATTTRQMPSMLANLIDLAELQIQANQVDQALRLIGLVRNHPAILAETAQKIETFLQNMSKTTPSEKIAADLQRGQADNLDEIVAEILKTTQT